MREIKVRCFDHEAEEMIDADEVLTIHNNRKLNESLISDEVFSFMQFTGFQDSKGNEIYEGDIVYVAGFSSKAKAIITHEHGSEFEDLDGCHRSMINVAAENDIGEVIGNIHQNPELLKD